MKITLFSPAARTGGFAAFGLVFAATFSEGSELNKIFLNRKNGDRVTPEIKREGKRGTKFVTLVQQTGFNVSLRQSHDR